MIAQTVIADITNDPGYGIVIGLIAGALAGLVMRGGEFGIVGDIIVGIIGALLGGFILSLLGVGTSGFWATLVAAFIGACILIALLRAVSGHRTAVSGQHSMTEVPVRLSTCADANQAVSLEDGEVPQSPLLARSVSITLPFGSRRFSAYGASRVIGSCGRSCWRDQPGHALEA
jgi:uncharacterized membrane protein YeaQ/YmgE (transglycosylase-associated protein family)